MDEAAEQSFVHDFLPTRIVSGPGVAHRQLAAELDRLGAARVFVVASQRALREHVSVVRALGDRHRSTFTDVRRHVPRQTVAEATDVALRADADLLLAIGGGSAIGLAKAVALARPLPIVAVPTTYAGSEMTPIWGMTENGRKVTGRDAVVVPRTVIYDVELTLSLPVMTSMASGVNALAHGIDSLWAPTATPMTRLQARRAIECLVDCLPRVHEAPHDVAARSDLLLGAWLAGTAFGVTGSAIHHKVCHVLGGRFDLPHAETHSVLLPHVVAFKAGGSPTVDAVIASALGVSQAGRALQRLNDRLGLPGSLRALGLSREQVLAATQDVLDVLSPGLASPMEREAVPELLANAWSGREL